MSEEGCWEPPPEEALPGTTTGWRMFLSLNEDEVTAIQAAAAQTLPGERFAVITEVLADGVDGSAELVLTLDAVDGKDAITKTEQAWAALRQTAELPAAPAELFAYMPPSGKAESLDVEVLRKAEVYWQQGLPSEAVIFAQTAAEMLATSTLRLLVRHFGAEWVADELVGQAVNLRGGQPQRVFNRLTGSQIQKESWWGEYTAHLQRRHAIVHEGARVTSGDAERSLDVVRTFRSFVSDAARRGFAGKGLTRTSDE